ncbi:poly(ADP-ribose) polymerase and DNA-Ligase zn-finger domain-containing protein, partial [Apiospora arundinis]
PSSPCWRPSLPRPPPLWRSAPPPTAAVARTARPRSAPLPSRPATTTRAARRPRTTPHTYNNYEGFNFRVDGPYQEFPIKTNGLYTGGSPGADRVIINTSCEEAGQITHTGASGNNFVGCSGTS